MIATIVGLVVGLPVSFGPDATPAQPSGTGAQTVDRQTLGDAAATEAPDRSTRVRVTVGGAPQTANAIASHVVPRLQPNYSVALASESSMTPSAFETSPDAVQVWIRVSDDGTVRILVADRSRSWVSYRELDHAITELVIEDVALGVIDAVGRLLRGSPPLYASAWDVAKTSLLNPFDRSPPSLQLAVGRGFFGGVALGATAHPPFGPTAAIEGGYMLAGKRRPKFRYSFGARVVHTALHDWGRYRPLTEAQARVRLGGAGRHLLGFAGLGVGLWHEPYPWASSIAGAFSIGAGLYGRVSERLMVGVEIDVGAQMRLFGARTTGLLGFTWHWDGAQ